MFNTYIEKRDALEAIKEVKTGRKEDIMYAVRAIPHVKLKRSRKLSLMHEEQGEEWCPHCRKKLAFYVMVPSPPKYCYCMYCGGAIKRRLGNKNGLFDYSILKAEGEDPITENELSIMPSIPQINFARAISNLLKIPLPEERSKGTYSAFIAAHQADYYRIRRRGQANNGKLLSSVRGEDGSGPSDRDV